MECYERNLENLGGISPWEDRPKEKEDFFISIKVFRPIQIKNNEIETLICMGRWFGYTKRYEILKIGAGSGNRTHAIRSEA